MKNIRISFYCQQQKTLPHPTFHFIATKQELRKAVNAFTAYNPNLPANRPFFKETSFRDLTINRITFSISALKPDVPLQQVDILLEPEKQQVKNLVIRQQFETPDSSNSIHMIWVDKMRKYFPQRWQILYKSYPMGLGQTN